jgi:glycerol-3-phosphate dehydrogenase (NAD(P)+)
MAWVGIIGGGAFGTAMACVLRRSGHSVLLWARETEVAAGINLSGRNDMFLPGVELVPGIVATTSMAEAAADADLVLLAPPAQHMRAVANELRSHLGPGVPVVSCSKGIERGTLALMPQVLAATLPDTPVGVLSGPSFAREIALDLPCGVALAFQDLGLARRLSSQMQNPRFCVHPCDDPVGAAIGGVMKNVVAIASGVAAGRKLGENARATVVTLGLAETVRLGLALGAKRETFDGLAGIGDMMLTANSLQSRNTSLGVALAEGQSLKDILSKRKEVTEGAHSAAAVVALAARRDVAMPIAEAVDQVLGHGASIDAMIARLLAHV